MSLELADLDTAKLVYEKVGKRAGLQELQFSDRSRRVRLPRAQNAVVRIRALPGLNTAWQQVKSRAREPYMVTMATGKSDDLGPLREVWRDAYRALSRAKKLEIIGYSVPPDDIEIRTLLRTGIQRGPVRPRLVILKSRYAASWLRSWNADPISDITTRCSVLDGPGGEVPAPASG